MCLIGFYVLSRCLPKTITAMTASSRHETADLQLEATDMTTKRILGKIEDIELVNIDKSGKNPRFHINFIVRPDTIIPSPKHPVGAVIFPMLNDGRRSAESTFVEGILRIRYMAKTPILDLPESLQMTWKENNHYTTSIDQYAQYRVGDVLLFEIGNTIAIQRIIEHHSQ